MNSFADWIWLTLWIFALIVLIWIIFSIIGDLFRDHQTSGWIKALWIICLVIFPWLTALIYLIARGRGMSERSMKAAAEMKQHQDEYIKQVAGSSGGSAAEQIKHAKDLLDSGAISQAEFDQLKSKALAS